MKHIQAKVGSMTLEQALQMRSKVMARHLALPTPQRSAEEIHGTARQLDALDARIAGLQGTTPEAVRLRVQVRP